MSNPYDPEEQDIRRQLVATRIMLHEERCKVESMTYTAKQHFYWKRDADKETLRYDQGDAFAGKTLPERVNVIVEHLLALKAENERLRKAGDAVVGQFIYENKIESESWGVEYEPCELVKAWRAAKEEQS